MLPLEEDDPEAAKKIQAQTRDSDPTIQLIVIYHIEGRDFLDPAGRRPFNEMEPPSLKRVRRLLWNEVTLGRYDCVKHYVARPVPTAGGSKPCCAITGSSGSAATAIR